MHLSLDDNSKIVLTRGEYGYIVLTFREFGNSGTPIPSGPAMSTLRKATGGGGELELSAQYVEVLHNGLSALAEVVEDGSTIGMLVQDSLSITESATLLLKATSGE